MSARLNHIFMRLRTRRQMRVRLKAPDIDDAERTKTLARIDEMTDQLFIDMAEELRTLHQDVQTAMHRRAHPWG